MKLQFRAHSQEVPRSVDPSLEHSAFCLCKCKWQFLDGLDCQGWKRRPVQTVHPGSRACNRDFQREPLRGSQQGCVACLNHAVCADVPHKIGTPARQSATRPTRWRDHIKIQERRPFREPPRCFSFAVPVADFTAVTALPLRARALDSFRLIAESEPRPLRALIEIPTVVTVQNVRRCQQRLS